MKFIIYGIINLLIGIQFSFGNNTIPTVRLKMGEEKGIDLTNYLEEFNSCTVEPIQGYDLFLRNDSLVIINNHEKSGYRLINLNCQNEQNDIMVLNEHSEFAEFEYADKHHAEKVYLMGNFNDWNRSSLPLEKNFGIWKISQSLTPGKYEYKFVVDGREILDPQNQDSIANGLGGWNSIIHVKEPHQHSPGTLIKQTVESKSDSILLKFIYNPGIAHDWIDNQSIIMTMDNSAVPQQKWSFNKNVITIQITDKDSGLLRICAENNLGQPLRENHTILVKGKPLTPAFIPDDTHFNIIYSIMVDRFKNGNSRNDKSVFDPDLHDLVNFHGGDLKGITRKISEGYFSDLGVNMLWISPVFKNPDSSRTESVYPFRRYSGYHGYWPVSSTEIDPRFGTDEDLLELVSKAHANGIRVILDFVANHVHEDHPYYMEHPEWFSSYWHEDGSANLRKWDGETRLTTWFDSFLPSFDYKQNIKAVNTVSGDAVNLVRRYNLDGFRQDATKHVPHAFWKYLTNKLKSEFPGKEIFQIGETFGSDKLIQSYVNPAELNSQFNFDLYFNSRQVFSGIQSNMLEFNQFILRNLDIYQPLNLMGTITSSHDQVRFMAFADNQIGFSENGIERAFHNPLTTVFSENSYNKLLMFNAVNFMMPGIPVIYYGEEYGQIGANDPGNRLDMRFSHEWNKNERMLNNKIKKLLKLRQNNPAAALGDLDILFQDQSCTVWIKRYFDHAILVMFNLSEKTRHLKLKTPGKFKYGMSINNKEEINFSNDNTHFLLEAYETRIYELYQ